MKYAKATEATINISSCDNFVTLKVIDNGKGFDTTATEKERKGKGLENIRDRIIALNGRFDIWSQPGQGTETSIEIEIQ